MAVLAPKNHYHPNSTSVMKLRMLNLKAKAHLVYRYTFALKLAQKDYLSRASHASQIAVRGSNPKLE